MQKSIQSTTMQPPQNPSNSIQETDSNKTTHVPEPENPFSLKNDSSETINSKPDDDDDDDDESAKRSHEAAPESVEPKKRREVEEEKESKCCTTVSPKRDGTVEDGGGSERERLKRYRVEVAGRTWIPDMWGQEDFLKDWVDCAAFDASLVNSSILLARDSLMEEGRRANSTRLRIHNG